MSHETSGFKDLFDTVQMDPEAKQVFLAMPREEQLLAIIGMQAWLRSDVANVKKDVIETKSDLKEFKREMNSYRMRREKKEEDRERGGEELLTTTQKIVREVSKAFSQRFDFWTWFRDKVLPAIMTAISLGILYAVFGPK
jgi:hypothetical protein